MYVDSSVIMGMTGEYDEGSKGFGKLQYMVCRPENDFFPDLSKVADCCRCMSMGKMKGRKGPAGLRCPACTTLATVSSRRGLMHITSLLYLGLSPCWRACLEVNEGLLKGHRRWISRKGGLLLCRCSPQT